MSDKKVKHQRSAYKFLDALGDYGGVAEVFITIFVLMAAPIAEHNFLLKAISKLYLAQTSDDYLFEQKKNPKLKQKLRIERRFTSQLSQKKKKPLK